MNIVKLKNPIPNIEIKNKKRFLPIDKNDNLKFYFNMLLVGETGSGKTNSAINIMKYCQDNKLVQDIYIITTTYDNNNFEDYLILKPENVFTNILTSADLENAIQIIYDECETNVKRWKNTRNKYTKDEYKKMYCNIFKRYLYYERFKNEIENDNELSEFKLSEEDEEILNDNNYSIKCTYYDIIPSFILCLDDMQGYMSNNNQQNPLSKIIIKHRHVHMSVIILTQTLTNALPKICRDNIKYAAFWDYSDEDVIKCIYKEFGNKFFKSYELFYDAYQFCIKEPHNFIMFDKFKKQVFKNFDNKIII